MTVKQDVLGYVFGKLGYHYLRNTRLKYHEIVVQQERVGDNELFAIIIITKSKRTEGTEVKMTRSNNDVYRWRI